MRRYRFIRPPRRFRNAKLDNLALVPASLLPFKQQWQELANQLPAGAVLIVLPTHGKPQRKTFKSVATLLTAQGHQVTTLLTEQFGREPVS